MANNQINIFGYKKGQAYACISSFVWNFVFDFLLALLFPTLILTIMNTGSLQGEVIEYVILFAVYLGLVFIATFFNVATVYTAKMRFSGSSSSVKESLSFAFSKIHLIFMWSVVSAIVGILLRLLDVIARKAKGGSKIILTLLRGFLGMAWAIVTIFVVPVLVYKGLGPFAAIKESAVTLKKTWGESLIRHFGLGFIQGVLIVVGIVVTALLFFAVLPLGSYAIGTVLFIGLIYIVLVILVFSVANMVYNIALYEYAQTGKIPEGFNREVLEHGFEKKVE